MTLIDQSMEYLKKNFDISPLVRSLKSKMILKFNEFDQLVKELILSVNSIHQISIAQQLLSFMKDKQDLEYIIE